MADNRMQTPNLTPEQKRLQPYVENIVWGLFGKYEYPPFDFYGSSIGKIEEFIESEETFRATYEYITTLLRIYSSKYPGQKLKINQPRQRMVFPELSSKQVMPEQRSSELHLENMKIDPTTPNDQNHQNGPVGVSTVTAGSAPTHNNSGVTPRPQSLSQPPIDPSSSQSPSNTTQPIGSAPINPNAKPGDISSGNASPGKPLPEKATFHINNAKAGQQYSALIEGTDSSGTQVRIRDVRFPSDLGLSFDEPSSMISGVPSVAGEFNLSLQWSKDGVAWNTGACLFIINPDPRSLWKCIEPEATLPYPKPHTDKALIKTENYQIVAASRRGRSHEHSGSFRDDDFYLAHDPDSGWSIAIVADGAGSAKYSRYGSKLAVEAFGNFIQKDINGSHGKELITKLSRWASDPTNASQALATDFHYLFHEAGMQAVIAIEAEASAKSASVKDYSTTLLAAVTRFDGDALFVSTFWMGDGAIAAYGPKGKVRVMGTPDGGEYAGQTRFLDRSALNDQGFGKRVRTGRFSDVTGVILMTDGVSDPRFETDAGLVTESKWDELWDELHPILVSSSPDQALVDWLHFFVPGHHDDRTLAILS